MMDEAFRKKAEKQGWCMPHAEYQSEPDQKLNELFDVDPDDNEEEKEVIESPVQLSKEAERNIRHYKPEKSENARVDRKPRKNNKLKIGAICLALAGFWRLGSALPIPTRL